MDTVPAEETAAHPMDTETAAKAMPEEKENRATVVARGRLRPPSSKSAVAAVATMMHMQTKIPISPVSTRTAAAAAVPRAEDFQVHSLKRRSDDDSNEDDCTSTGLVSNRSNSSNGSRLQRKRPTTDSTAVTLSKISATSKSTSAIGKIRPTLTVPTARTAVTVPASIRTSSRALTVPRSRQASTTRSISSSTKSISSTKSQRPAIAANAANAIATTNSNPAAIVSSRVATKKKRPDWDTKGRLADLEEQYHAAQSKLADSTSQVSIMESTLSDNQAMIKELLHFRATLEKTVQTKEKQVSHVETELSSIQTENNLLKARHDTEIQQLSKDHDSKVSDLCSELNSLKVAHESISNELTLSKSEVAQLKIALSAQAAAKITIESTNCVLTASLHESQNTVRIRDASIKTLELDIKTLVTTVSELETKLRGEESARRKLHNTIQELKGNIRVFCRVRPPLGAEVTDSVAETSPHIVYSDSDEGMIELVQMHVFQPATPQAEVFEEISQLVQSALDGYNVCIFAYGQTGSGKTFTMEGPSHISGPDDENIGMIPRAVEQIFQSANHLTAKGWVYTMEAQFIEIYNETIRDLLSGEDASSVTGNFNGSQGSSKKHEIRHDHTQNRTSITDVVNVHVTTPKEVFSLLKKASLNRAVAATNCNERSSRSHSVFTLRLSGVNTLTEETSYGILNLIDLAGSERLSSSGSTGDRLKETQAINKSLSCLGDVILALSNKETHIPYRNSKLTYLLQNSLGGNSKTLMVDLDTTDTPHLLLRVSEISDNSVMQDTGAETVPLSLSDSHGEANGSNSNAVQLDQPPLLQEQASSLQEQHHSLKIQEDLHLTAVWQRTKYPLQLPPETTVMQLKQKLQTLTGVQTDRQKLLGLVKGKLPPDSASLASLAIASNLSFNMMGSVQEQIFQPPPDGTLSDIIDDMNMDIDYNTNHSELQLPHIDPVNISSLEKITRKTNIHLINSLRSGKKLLVLDLDLTLFDCKTPATHIDLLARPGLHDFLATVYAYYDICIWSQTSWKWLEMKITELGMLTHLDYRIAFVMDQSTMFSIVSLLKPSSSTSVSDPAIVSRSGTGSNSASASGMVPTKHQVKPLQLIWNKFPGRFDASNTIHVDDLQRNFAMNPQSGLKISAFRNGPVSRATDRELVSLGMYLVRLSLVDDFRQLDHKKWKRFKGPFPLE
ncbi:hypothetical protein BASA61_004076 [Batrachochytrium salamandrivorans]|nr:hypothetical protein BASA61_004076 [Batrachochytrium salamandrivorans]